MYRCLASNVGALHSNLLAALGSAIVSGKYSPGEVITLDGVSAEHGMSRSVAREAIRVLESMGMVESRRRVGITIQPSKRLECVRPDADPLAAGVRRPGGATAVAVRTAAGVRAGRCGAGGAARGPAPVQDHGGSGVGHGGARPLGRPGGISAGRQDLPSDDAGGQRQRDVPRAERRWWPRCSAAAPTTA